MTSVITRPSAPTKKPAFQRIEVLEPLRGMAAMAVAWFHFTRGGPLVPSGTWLHSSGSYGWLGVEVFFVISGFIIPYSMDRGGYRLRSDIGRFVAKRVIRLDPPYLVAIALIIALLYASASVPGFQGAPPSVGAGQVLAHLGYLNAFLGYEWLSPVFWTLAIEFQFYILIAILYPILAHHKAGVRFAVLAGLAASAYFLKSHTLVFHYAGLFALGGATFHRRTGRLGDAGFLAIVALLTLATAGATQPVIAGLGAVTALVIAYVEIPRVAALSWLGAVSYSFYLLHVPIGGRVVNLGARVAGSPTEQLVVIGLAVVVSLIASWMMYRFVERPAQKWSSAIRYSKPTE